MKIQIKNIICTTDLSEFSNQAIPLGVALAKEFDAKLHLCHVFHSDPYTSYEDVMVDTQEKIRRIATDYAFEKLKQMIGEVEVNWEPLVTVGGVAEEIERITKEKCGDIVISATQGRSGVPRLIMGSVTGRLMRTLPCPLLSVQGTGKDLVDQEKQDIRLRRILVGCDFSPDSNLAFQYALSLAQEFQSEIHLVHVIEPPVYKDLFKSAVEPGEKMRQDLRIQLNQKLNQMIPEEIRNWCTPSTLLLAGSPHEELTKYGVLNDMDLIVLGVRGHGLAETLLVGSTTDRVIRKASCPVLSVRPAIQCV